MMIIILYYFGLQLLQLLAIITAPLIYYIIMFYKNVILAHGTHCNRGIQQYCFFCDICRRDVFEGNRRGAVRLRQ